MLLREPPRCDALGYWPAFESFPLPFALQPRCLELQKPTWLRQTKLKISDGRTLTRFMVMELDQKGVCVCVCVCVRTRTCARMCVRIAFPAFPFIFEYDLKI